MAEPRPSRVLSIIVAIIVVAAGIGIFAFLYYENHKSPASGPLTVQSGDNVTVNYIGILGSGPQEGRVFDTSVYSVALNNASWPKTLMYASRGGVPSDYSPLAVHVGPSAPSGGYTIGNLTFGSVVPGFWQGLLGLPGNKTHYITIPQNLGYPSTLINASCYVTEPLTYTYPVVQTLAPAAFTTAFPNVTALAGTGFTDPSYGWQDQILSVNSSAVVYENLPSQGMLTNPNGWAVKVTNISATTISLANQLSPTQAGQILGHVSGTGVCGATTFIVSQVNLGAGTYVADYGDTQQHGNQQVYGQTLIFIVTVVDIFP
jgi:hypothetical protein